MERSGKEKPMRYILLPIHPEWCCKLMNGDKKTEVRRGTTLYNAINRLIKEQGKAPCLIYCTKGNPYLWKFWFEGDDGCGYCYETSFAKDEYSPKVGETINGKVVAEFEASAEEISIQFYGDEEYEDYKEIRYETTTAEQSELLRRSCLTYQQIRNYLGEYPKHEPIGTAIYVHNLKIFGKPKELKEFKKVASKKTYTDLPWLEPSQKAVFKSLSPITNAPQSWCYCEVEE